MTEKKPSRLERLGYALDEVTSALQKTIRLGDERAATWWGLLLYDAAPFYAWKRVVITAAEDIGPAGPGTVHLVNTLHLSWRTLKQTSYHVDPHNLTMAIVMLCRAKKSTEVEDLQTLTLVEIEAGSVREVPDFAKDEHTKAGRALGRGDRHWYKSRRDELNVPTNPYTEMLWKLRPEWDPDLEES